MAIPLRPFSERVPQPIEEAEYERLVKRAREGWSDCADETEWLAKLHYLRSGFRQGKLERAQFEERETRLVVGWLKRLCQ
ncbi:MAG: hypothetical protein HY423_01320 [Candidatus Lambdaproteobacteria bacterium]|nr:hypothetical protein [Candidatus Lambdaproteobacteria bacterium]